MPKDNEEKSRGYSGRFFSEKIEDKQALRDHKQPESDYDPDLELGVPTSEIETKATSTQHSISAWKIVQSLSTIVLAKENRPRIIAASVLTGISTALNFVTPYLLGVTIESLQQNEKDESQTEAPSPVALVLMLLAAQTLSQIVPTIRDQVLAPVTARNTQKVVTSITEHQLNKSLDYHSKVPFGDQIYLLQKGFSVTGSISPILTKITPTLFEIIMAIAVLTHRYGSGMGMGVAGTAVLYTAYSAATTKPIIAAREIMINTGRETWQKIDGALKQYKNIHDFCKYDYEMKAVTTAVKKAAAAEINAITAPLKVGYGHIAIPRLGMLGAALYVVAGVQSQRFNIQDFILLMSYLNQLATMIPAVGQALNGLFAAYPDFKFVFSELAQPSEIIDRYPSVPLEVKAITPSIRFENVAFSYPKIGDEKEKISVFKDLSFTIESGQTVAFVSQTGGGKSSIFKLLYGYNTPSQGKIYINGQDISQVSRKSLQSQIGLVGQVPNLFNASVRDNIRYGAENPDSTTDQEIMALAKALNLEEFINTLEKKLDTSVGENGMQLSGGQQQRVAIIRGLLKQTPIRLFDEITSALDGITADKVLAGILNLTKDQTRLIISHKLAETQHADKIFVLADGGVIAAGTHSQLLKDCPLYLELWHKKDQAQSKKIIITDSEQDSESSLTEAPRSPREQRK
jgi:ABC-type multidrug transport system fused ATPase/permease subunit